MKLKERVLRRLNGQEVDMTPVGSTTTYGCVAFMKRCGVTRPEVDSDPQALALMAIAGHTVGGFDWIRAMGSDITAASELLGCKVHSPAPDAPYAIASHPCEHGDVDGLDCPDDLLSRGRMPAYREQFRILKAKFGKDLAIYGASEGPFTCAANLMDAAPLMKAAIEAPGKVEKVMAVTTETLIRMIRFAAGEGADYYCLAEPSSTPALLSPKYWDRFVGPYIRKIVDSVPCPVVLHICGQTAPIIRSMCGTGVAGISIEEKMDMQSAVRIAHAMGVKVFGNVSTAATLFSGTPEECRAEAMAALAAGTDFLCPGCGIDPNSPLDNVLQMRLSRDEKFGQPKFTPAERVVL